jgi:hypothetical protein
MPIRAWPKPVVEPKCVVTNGSGTASDGRKQCPCKDRSAASPMPTFGAGSPDDRITQVGWGFQEACYGRGMSPRPPALTTVAKPDIFNARAAIALRAPDAQ